ncbi:M20/M25/M40 family metallo-hydrolase [Blastococcus sp. CCUG 61487]|uniref:M20/M25/M40 family metallo-hydrolase n=1 Tax=Blastococcus sp. CCUG 61487 TaxID=1840703 RepID=UPI0010BF7CD0|nr:M20/M25/M40 family metallo-hydrolase [Blastococcus sp. CCUG 61487]TKJ17974.1 hypothetical protein A6V29_01140 [Blastococcus sp. CCUG 61487]
MKLVLFDLGQTLEDGGVLRPGALQLLQDLAGLEVGRRPAVLLGLLSDVTEADTPDDVPGIREQYHALLDGLGIRRFFEPVDRRVTLCTEVGVRKPAPAAFRAAIAKAEPALFPDDVLFVTEDVDHVRAARRLGLHAVRIGAPGGGEEAAELPDVLPLVLELIGDSASSARRADGAWTLLGADLVVTGRPVAGLPDQVARISAARTSAARTSAVPTPRTRTVAAAGERLHLVTQHGRLFQADHPDVPVLVDRGRYLVVELEASRAEELRSAGSACWSVRPLPTGVVAAQRPASPRRPSAPDVESLLSGLSADEVAADVATLAGHRTRHSGSRGFDEAATWAAARLAATGCTVTTQPVPAGGPTCRNVIGDRPGSGPEPRGVVVVTAHLDSVNLRGPDEPAPGADDNASGSAGLLALARALSDREPLLDLRFVLFGGEEQGLLGSRRFVAGLAGPDRARIRAVVNMDMIGVRNGAAHGVLIEGAAVSSELIDALAAAAADHTDLAVTTSHSPYASDHVPFIEAGIPAVLTIEAVDEANTAVHTERDRVERIDPQLAVSILRMNLAFVGAATGAAGS